MCASVTSAVQLNDWTPQRWSVAEDWRPLVDRFLRSDTGLSLGDFMRARLSSGAVIYPPQPFRALAVTPLAQVRLVILGQDPYHGPGQAEGLAFSVAAGVKPPPSLRNIFKEVAREGVGGQAQQPFPGNSSLLRWAEQGVLLLNTSLTVEAGEPGSHAQRGWEALTDQIIIAVAEKQTPVVFMLWGAHAQAKEELIASRASFARANRMAHLVLKANHPSPLSALRAPLPFIGCDHFRLANTFLLRQGSSAINW